MNKKITTLLAITLLLSVSIVGTASAEPFTVSASSSVSIRSGTVTMTASTYSSAYPDDIKYISRSYPVISGTVYRAYAEVMCDNDVHWSSAVIETIPEMP